MSMGAQGMLGEYVQNSVETENPLDLVCMLYGKAIERLKAAREHMERKEIPARANAIALASQIIVELQTTLDAERGGEIAVNLARVYDYVQEQLAEANAQQTAEPLEVSLRLLETLYEGWQECRSQNPEIPRADKSADKPSQQTAAAQPPRPARFAEDAAEDNEDQFDTVGVGHAPSRAWTL